MSQLGRVDSSWARRELGRDWAESIADRTILSALQGHDFSSHGPWKANENEMSFVEEVIFPSLIQDAHQVVFCSPLVRKDAIDLANDERGLVRGVIDAQNERLG